ncbi:MAG: DUF1573 domain-containing protein [bacterium]
MKTPFKTQEALCRWLCACLVVSATVLGQTNLPRPRLVCDEPLFDYGIKPNSIEIEHDFVIRNTGDLPLIISQVRSGCGCTRAQLSQNTLAPGSNAVLSARLSLRGVVGPKQTHIYLHSNDPENPVFQCKMAGSAVIDPSVKPPPPATPAPPVVERDLSSFPPEITIDPSETVPLGNVHYVIVRGKNDQPFNVTNVVVIPPAFPARLHSMKQVWARLKVGPITPASLGSGAVVRVYTDMPGAMPLDIPVRPVRSP